MNAKYALRALATLALNAPGQLPASRIARYAGVPAKFLEAILVDLRKAGLVESRRGNRGGHRLTRDSAAAAQPRPSNAPHQPAP